MPVRISKNRVALENIPLNEAATVIVASATSTPIGGAASNNVDISGATTITSFDNVAEGINRKGRFTGALTLTHNATSLILPGAANITTAANDRYEARSLGSGNWIVTKYQKADGTAVVAPSAESWTTPAFSAGDFTASGTMTWTVEAGDVITYSYMINGKTMSVNLYIKQTTVGGTLSTGLRVAIPASKVSNKRVFGVCKAYQGSWVVSAFEISAGSAYIEMFPTLAADATNWAASTNGTENALSATFEIQ